MDLSNLILEYQYSTLDANTIRILTIEPALDTTAPIICDIEHILLDTAADYDALSYSWGMNDDGEASMCRSMYIQGMHKAITRNLFEGLLRIRDCHESRTLWIDAVCINQDDDLERSAQVQTMARIFATATIVYFWLGEGESEELDEAAFEVLSCFTAADDHNHAHDIHKARKGPADICELRNLSESPDMFAEYSDEGKRRLITGFGAVARVLHKIVARRLFKRQWVAQELYFAEIPMLCWGSRAVSLLKFELCLQRFRLIQCILDDYDNGTQGSGHDEITVAKVQVSLTAWMIEHDVLDILIGLRKGRNTDIAAILDSCKMMHCTDPRDRLYALLSLDESCSIPPDYTISAASAYTEFAKMLVYKGMGHVILANCAQPSERDELYDALPTWVPDLRYWFSHNPTIAICPSDNFEMVVERNSILHCSLPYLGNLTEVAMADDNHYSDRYLTVRLTETSNGLTNVKDGGPTEERFYFQTTKSGEPLISINDGLTMIVTVADGSVLDDRGIFVHALRMTSGADEKRARIVLPGRLYPASWKDDPQWLVRARALVEGARRRVFDIV